MLLMLCETRLSFGELSSNYIQNDTFKSNNDYILLPTMTYKNLFGFRE